MGTHVRPRATVRRIGARDGQSGGGNGGSGQSGGDANAASGAAPPEQCDGGVDRRLGAAAAEMLNALHAAKEELARELEANLKQLKTVLEETQRIQKQMEAVLSEAKSEASLKEKAQGRQTGPHRQDQAAQAKGQGKPADQQQGQPAQQQQGQAAAGGQQAQGTSQQQQEQETWKPAVPGPEQAARGDTWGENFTGSGFGQIRPWQPPDPSASGRGTDLPPPWEPPVEATRPQNQRPTQH